MKRRHLLSFLSFLSFMLSSAVFAQTEVSEFRPGATLEGVNYFLPKTVFRVVVEAEKATTIPGEFATYADRYLRLKDVPTLRQDTWTLKSVTLLPYGVPDSTKAFSIKVKSKTSAPLVSLTDDGLLLAINTEAEAEPEPNMPKPVPAGKPVNGREFMTKEILAAASTSKMAQLTAEEIYDIRESLNALLRGEADNTPKDGAQLKLMLDGLTEQAYALETLFKGQTLTSTEVFQFDFDPSAMFNSNDEAKNMEARTILCRFSQRLGLVEGDDLSGEPLWINIRMLGNLPSSVEDADVQRRQAKMDKGVWVNQPARAQVTVANASATLAQMEASLSQFGTLEVLSAALFDKKPETRVTFYQHTGSVKRLE